MHSPSPLAAPRQREHTTWKPGCGSDENPSSGLTVSGYILVPGQTRGWRLHLASERVTHLPSRGCNCEHPGAWCVCECMQVCV